MLSVLNAAREDAAMGGISEERVMTLRERLTSMHGDDRREAAASLKEAADQNPKLLSSLAFGALLTAAGSNRDDVDFVRTCLESVQIAVEAPTEQAISVEICRAVVDGQHINSLLELLEESDWGIRYACLRIMSALIPSFLPSLQTAVLANPVGLQRLMDMLGDSREIIRNEVLVLLNSATRDNEHLQQFLGFSNAFGSLLEVISEEDMIADSVVVDDCVAIIRNLLENSTSNQNLFRENGNVQLLSSLIESKGEQALAPAVQILLSLLTPPSGEESASFKQTQGVVGAVLMHQMCQGLQSPHLSVVEKSTILRCMSLCVLHNSATRDKVAADDGDGSAVLGLLAGPLLDSTAHSSARLESLLCVEAFLHSNVNGQREFASTIMQMAPEMLPDNSFALGRTVVKCILDHADALTINDGDILGFVGACRLLCCSMYENDVVKELAAGVPVEVPLQATSQPPKFINRMIELLKQSLNSKYSPKGWGHPAICASLLRVFIVWTDGCPAAVRAITDQMAVTLQLVELFDKHLEQGQYIVYGLNACLFACLLKHCHDADISSSLTQILTSKVGVQRFEDASKALQDSAEFKSGTKWKRTSSSPPVLAGVEQDWQIPVFDDEICSMITDSFNGFQKRLYSAVANIAPSPQRPEATQRDSINKEEFLNLKESNKKLSQKVESLEQQLAALRPERDAATQKATSLEEDLRNLNATHSMIENLLENKKKELDVLQGRVDHSEELELAVEQLRRKVEQSDGKADSMALKVADLERENAETKQLLQSTMQEKEEIELKFCELQKEHEDLLCMVADDDDEDEGADEDEGDE